MKTLKFKLIAAAITAIALLNGRPLQAQVKGADVSWVTQMEASGYVWYNSSGVKQDVFTILKGLGFNAIRLRVWVNPSGGWCGKTDVVNKAKRAKAAGFDVMLDFHYSDSWADPGKQTKPAAWSSITDISQLCTQVYNHTLDVCNAVKSAGVTPKWVQVGNETNNGMLWPEGKASTNMKNFAWLVNSGNDAVKAVFPSAVVIVHLSNGYDNSLYRWLFDGLKANGARYDCIGMSLYPSPSDWSTKTSQCLANMKDMKSRYGKSVMICEVGMSWDQPTACGNFLKDIIAKVRSVGGLGVFYWEPQAYNWQGYTLGAWDPNTKKPTAALSVIASAKAPVAVENVETQSPFAVYPNPLAQNQPLVIKANHGNSIQKVKILTVNGQVIGEYTPAKCVTFSLNQLRLAPGTYFVQIEALNNRTVQTLIVK